MSVQIADLVVFLSRYELVLESEGTVEEMLKKLEVNIGEELADVNAAGEALLEAQGRGVEEI